MISSTDGGAGVDPVSGPTSGPTSGREAAVSTASADWVYLRDTIRVNGALLTELQAENPAPGTRLVLIAREIIHDPGFVFPLTGFPVLLVAETYRGNGGAVATTGPAGVSGTTGAAGSTGGSGPDNVNGTPGQLGGNGAPGGTATPITLFAATLTELTLNARGGLGGHGGNGGRGGSGKDGVKPPPGKDGRDPGSGGRGGNGGNAAVGGAGAQIRVEAVTRSGVSADGSGGDPGDAGRAGSGGSGGGGWNGPGETGPDGVDGLPGTAAGSSVPPNYRVHTVASWWAAVRAELGDAYTHAWAEYRTRVGEFLFRTYAPGLPQRAEARVAAGHEFGQALVLWPQLDRAAELSRHLAHNLTPIGVPYNVDLMPDFPAQESFVAIYAPLVQASLIAARDLLLFAIGKADKIQLVSAQVAHLTDLQPVLQTERDAAKAGLLHARGRADVIDAQIREVNVALGEVREMMAVERLEFPPGNDLGPMIDAAKALGEAGSAVFTGGASLVAMLAVADLLPKGSKVLDEFSADTGMYGDGTYLVNWFDWSGMIPKLRADQKIDDARLEKLADQATKYIHAADTMADLLKAKVDGMLQNAEKSLLIRQLGLIRERALQILEVSQKELTLAAADGKIAVNANDIARLTNLQGDWAGDVAQLVDITRRLINQNQHYMDLLIEYCFYAYRALDLWTLSNRTPKYSFDMGYLHPDNIENAYRPLPRGDDSRVKNLIFQYQSSWDRLPQLADLHQIHDKYPLDQDLHYVDLNTPELLVALQTKGTATFTLPLDAFPNRFAMKVAYVHVGLLGARAETPRMTVLIEHGGTSTNRAEDGTTVDAQAGPLSSTVQATFDKQDPGTPSVRQAFWGRSPVATWRITIEKSAAEQAKLDLGGLNDVFLTLWYWHRGVTPSGPAAARMALTADFDGDGRQDEVIWDPADGSWRVTPASGGGTRVVFLGQVGDLPVPADYDGDGNDEVAVFRPATGKLFARALAGSPPVAYHWAAPDHVLTVAERPDAERLVLALDTRARQLYGAVRAPESVDPQSAACVLLRRLATLDAGYRPRLGEALVVLTTYLAGAERWDEAVATGEEAVALYRTLAAEHPGNDEFVYRISWASVDVALHLWAKAELRTKATDLAVQAIDNLRSLAGRSPGYRRQLALWAASPTTGFLALAGRWDQAVALGDESIALYRKLAAENPADDELAYGVSSASIDIAVHLWANPALNAKATDLAVQAIDNLRSLAGRNPNYRRQLAHWAASPTTGFLADSGRWDEAVAISDEAIGTYQLLIDEDPADDELGYVFVADSIGIATRLWGKPEFRPRAAAMAAVTMQTLRPIAVRNPAYRPQLADWIMSPTVGFLVETGDKTSAIAWVREAIDLYVVLNGTDPATYGPKLEQARQRLAQLVES